MLLKESNKAIKAIKKVIPTVEHAPN